ncbi:MAG: hypothetical protein KDC57_07460 [Saprospiraceae bacterium]|nr:hypothetical protein [Saprospiraceae bacterium]
MNTSSFEIQVKDLADAEKFYRFIFQKKGRKQKGKRFLFKLPCAEIYLTEKKQLHHSVQEFMLVVDQLEHYYARFKAFDPGLVLHGLYEVPGQFTALDPFGNKLTLMQK